MWGNVHYTFDFLFLTSSWFVVFYFWVPKVTFQLHHQTLTVKHAQSWIRRQIKQDETRIVILTNSRVSMTTIFIIRRYISYSYTSLLSYKSINYEIFIIIILEWNILWSSPGLFKSLSLHKVDGFIKKNTFKRLLNYILLN